MALFVSTNLTPPVQIDGQTGGGGGKLLRLLKPTIDGSLPIIGNIHYAPYGEASPAIGAFLLYGFVGLAIYGAWTLGRRVLGK